MKTKNHHLDTHAIAFKDSAGEEHWLETHHGERRADHYCKVVNDHEVAHGRDERFYVVRCP